MRLIEFRSKKEDGGEWVFGHIFEIHPDYDACIIMDDGYHINCLKSSLGEYTTVNDKNNKKSFEGDTCSYALLIFHYPRQDDLPQKIKGTGIIEMIAGCFMIVDKRQGERIPLFTQDLSFEVTGNIHQK